MVKTIFLGEVQVAIRLGIKFLFGDVGLAQVTPFCPVVSFLTHQSKELVFFEEQAPNISRYFGENNQKISDFKFVSRIYNKFSKFNNKKQLFLMSKRFGQKQMSDKQAGSREGIQASECCHKREQEA